MDIRMVLFTFVILCQGGSTHAHTSDGITLASGQQVVDIKQLIKKIDFASDLGYSSLSKYTTIGKTGVYRLAQQPTAGEWTKFRIHSGPVTYGIVLIRIDSQDGHDAFAIRHAFVRSVRTGQTVRLE